MVICHFWMSKDNETWLFVLINNAWGVYWPSDPTGQLLLAQGKTKFGLPWYRRPRTIIFLTKQCSVIKTHTLHHAYECVTWEDLAPVPDAKELHSVYRPQHADGTRYRTMLWSVFQPAEHNWLFCPCFGHTTVSSGRGRRQSEFS
jgi:hypothetical protein